MKVAGIVAEYNPFHNGHLYHIEKTRQEGYDHIVAVMSGNVVQRGEPAFFSKYTRTEAALRNGVDLVLELPAVYACASAERYAFAAISILEMLGLVEAISFGSECGDVEELTRCAEACEAVNGTPYLKDLLEKGMSFVMARQKAVAELHSPALARLLNKPNNILGVEYIKALHALSSSMTPITIPRRGPDHDSDKPAHFYASGSFLRNQIQQEGIYAGKTFLPSSAYELFRKDFVSKRGGASIYKIEPAVLYRLRTMKPHDFALLPDVSGGLEFLLAEHGQTAVGLEDFISGMMSSTKKNCTKSRIRHIIYAAMLHISKELRDTPPPYIRVLGSNDKGKELLRMAKKKNKDIPKYEVFSAMMKDYPVFGEVESLATDLFRLSCPEVIREQREFQAQHRSYRPIKTAEDKSSE